MNQSVYILGGRDDNDKPIDHILKISFASNKLEKMWWLLHYLESTQPTYLPSRNICEDMVEMYQVDEDVNEDLEKEEDDNE